MVLIFQQHLSTVRCISMLNRMYKLPDVRFPHLSLPFHLYYLENPLSCRIELQYLIRWLCQPFCINPSEGLNPLAEQTSSAVPTSSSVQYQAPLMSCNNLYVLPPQLYTTLSNITVHPRLAEKSFNGTNSDNRHKSESLVSGWIVGWAWGSAYWC